MHFVVLVDRVRVNAEYNDYVAVKLIPILYENSAIDVDVEELYANLPSKYQHRILVLELALKRFSSAAAVALKR